VSIYAGAEAEIAVFGNQAQWPRGHQDDRSVVDALISARHVGYAQGDERAQYKVRRWLALCEARLRREALALVKQHRSIIGRVAQAPLERVTLQAHEIDALLDQRTSSDNAGMFLFSINAAAPDERIIYVTRCARALEPATLVLDDGSELSGLALNEALDKLGPARQRSLSAMRAPTTARVLRLAREYREPHLPPLAGILRCLRRHVGRSSDDACLCIPTRRKTAAELLLTWSRSRRAEAATAAPRPS
jgi:hypothetical protein